MTAKQPVTDAEVLRALQEAHDDPRSMEDLFATADDIRARLETERGIKNPQSAAPAAVAPAESASVPPAAAKQPELNPGDYVTPLWDHEVHAQFPQFAEALTAWRNYFLSVFRETGPVAWRVRAGFTLLNQAPKAGPCYDNLDYVRSWSIMDAPPTNDGLVFWVPRLAPGSKVSTADDMAELRQYLRKQFGLPSHHCTGFGSIPLIFALILAHFNRTHGRTPAELDYAVSDSYIAGGHRRLIAGNFGNAGLTCAAWNVANPYCGVGFFLLGVEPLGTQVLRP